MRDSRAKGGEAELRTSEEWTHGRSRKQPRVRRGKERSQASKGQTGQEKDTKEKQRAVSKTKQRTVRQSKGQSGKQRTVVRQAKALQRLAKALQRLCKALQRPCKGFTKACKGLGRCYKPIYIYIVYLGKLNLLFWQNTGKTRSFGYNCSLGRQNDFSLSAFILSQRYASSESYHFSKAMLL